MVIFSATKEGMTSLPIIGPLYDSVTWYKIAHAGHQVKVDWYKLLCVGSPTVQLALQHVRLG